MLARVLVLLLSVFLTTPVFSQAETGLTMGEAINKAGRQRMLTQRIVKASLQVDQKILLGKAYDQLDESIALFDSQLKELTKFASTDEEKAKISEISLIWKKIKPVVSKGVDTSQLVSLDQQAEVLLKNSHEFVKLLEKRSGTNAGVLVNISGRQRMLTQRMAKFYLFQSGGMSSEQTLELYSKAKWEFTNALEKLTSSNENTPEINQALALVDRDWKLFGMSELVDSKHYVPSIVSRSLDSILVRMNEITAMYAKL